MEKKNVILVRHGQSTANRDRDYGKNAKLDPSLSELGINQAQKLIGHIKLNNPDLVLVSPLSRAIETANIIYEGNGPYFITPLHSERWSCPSDEGVTASELSRKHNYVSKWNGFNKLSENWTPTRISDSDWKERRIPDFLNFLKETPEKHIVVVGHGVFFKTICGKHMKNGEIFEMVV